MVKEAGFPYLGNILKRFLSFTKNILLFFGKKPVIFAPSL